MADSLRASSRREADRRIAEAAAGVLLGAVEGGELSAGHAADLARRISERAALAGVDLDNVLDLAFLGSRA